MSPEAIRLFLVVFGLLVAAKAATAPRRGTFLTLFGVVSKYRRPRLFQVCLVASYALAFLALLLARVI